MSFGFRGLWGLFGANEDYMGIQKYRAKGCIWLLLMLEIQHHLESIRFLELQ